MPRKLPGNQPYRRRQLSKLVNCASYGSKFWSQKSLSHSDILTVFAAPSATNRDWPRKSVEKSTRPTSCYTLFSPSSRSSLDVTSRHANRGTARITIDLIFNSQVLNPLDAVCNVPRPDAICVSNLRNAKKADKAVLSERPDVKIFLPFRFYFYRVEELFTPNTYNKFLGKSPPVASCPHGPEPEIVIICVAECRQVPKPRVEHTRCCH